MDLPGTDQPVSDVERDLSQKLVSAALLTAQVAEAAVWIRQQAVEQRAAADAAARRVENRLADAAPNAMRDYQRRRDGQRAEPSRGDARGRPRLGTLKSPPAAPGTPGPYQPTGRRAAAQLVAYPAARRSVSAPR